MTFVARRQLVEYTSTARVLVAEPAAETALVGLELNPSKRYRDLLGEAELAGSDQVRAAVRARFPDAGSSAPEGLVKAEKDLDVLVFVATGSSAAESIDVANAWAEEYVTYKRVRSTASIEQSIELLQGSLDEAVAERSEIRQELDRLEGRLARNPSGAERADLERRIAAESVAVADELGLIEALVTAYTRGVTELELRADLAEIGQETIIREARVGTVRSTAMPWTVYLVLAVAIGLLIGMGLVMSLELADRSISKPEDVAELGVEVLTTVPWLSASRRKDELVNDTIAAPDSELANAHQRLVSSLGFVAVDNEVGSVAITSANQGEGKSVVAANLALANAAIGRRVILADAHQRRPKLHDVFAMPLSPGLSDATEGGLTVEPTRIDQQLIQPPGSLGVIAAGDLSSRSVNLLAGRQLGPLVESWDRRSDMVVVDGPSVLAGAEMSALANRVDGIVVVAMMGRTKKADLAASLLALRRAGGRILGVVLVGKRPGLGRLLPWGSSEAAGHVVPAVRPPPAAVAAR